MCGAPGSPEDTRAFFLAWIGHGNAGDWDRFVRLMHPDIVLADPMMLDPARGREQELDRAVDPPGFAPTGRRVEIEGCSVLRFRDRQVVDVRLFFDTTDAARQLLAAPAAGSPLERVAVLAQRPRAWWSRRSLRS